MVTVGVNAVFVGGRWNQLAMLAVLVFADLCQYLSFVNRHRFLMLLGPAGRENGAFNHLSLTGDQLLYLMEERLGHLADYIGGLHPDVQAWYDLLLSLAEKGLFSSKLLIPPSYFPENRREIHPSVEE